MVDHAGARVARARILACAKRHFFSFYAPRVSRHANHDADRAFMAQGERIHVSHAGERLEVRSWGTGARVLLVHGQHVSGGEFRGLIPRLVAEGLQAIAFDAPGHGATGGPFVDIDEIADSMLDIESVVGPFAGLVAHSMGVAWAIRALQAGLRVSRIVCVGASTSVEHAVDAYIARYDLDSDVALHFRRLFRAFYSVPALSETLAVGTSHALIVHDRDDPLAPFAWGEELARAWPGSRTLWTSRLGHFKVLSNPMVAGEVAMFLAERQVLVENVV